MRKPIVAVLFGAPLVALAAANPVPGQGRCDTPAASPPVEAEMHTTDLALAPRMASAALQAAAARMVASTSEKERAAGLYLRAMRAIGEAPLRDCDTAACTRARIAALPAVMADRQALARLAATSSDPEVYGIARALCSTTPLATPQDGACATIDVAGWARVDPANASAWLTLFVAPSSDAPTRAAAWARAAAATMVDQRIGLSLEPLAAPEVLALPPAGQRAAMEQVTSSGYALALALPDVNIVPAIEACRGDALRLDGRAAECEAISRVLAGPRASLMDLVKATAVGRASGWPEARVAAQREEVTRLQRAMITLWTTAGAPTCDAVEREYAFWWTVRTDGEAAAARGLLIAPAEREADAALERVGLRLSTSADERQRTSGLYLLTVAERMRAAAACQPVGTCAAPAAQAPPPSLDALARRWAEVDPNNAAAWADALARAPVPADAAEVDALLARIGAAPMHDLRLGLALMPVDAPELRALPLQGQRAAVEGLLGRYAAIPTASGHRQLDGHCAPAQVARPERAQVCAAAGRALMASADGLSHLTGAALRDRAAGSTRWYPEANAEWIALNQPVQRHARRPLTSAGEQRNAEFVLRFGRDGQLPALRGWASQVPD